jgi:DNA polymerase III epsilon subunit-like protein
MIALDIEASGVDYQKNSIISIGALDTEHPTNRFYGECRVWEGSHISEDTMEFLQMTEAQFRDPTKQTEADLLLAFLSWSEGVRDRTFLGQNVSFDRDYLKAACDRIHHEWNFAHRTVDTHSLCYMHMIKRGLTPPFNEEHHRTALNLDSILLYCGIPEEPQPHNALTGALSHAEVAHRLLYDKKFLPEFDQFEIPWQKA